MPETTQSAKEGPSTPEDKERDEVRELLVTSLQPGDIVELTTSQSKAYFTVASVGSFSVKGTLVATDVDGKSFSKQVYLHKHRYKHKGKESIPYDCKITVGNGLMIYDEPADEFGKVFGLEVKIAGLAIYRKNSAPFTPPKGYEKETISEVAVHNVQAGEVLKIVTPETVFYLTVNRILGNYIEGMLKERGVDKSIKVVLGKSAQPHSGEISKIVVGEDYCLTADFGKKTDNATRETFTINGLEIYRKKSVSEVLLRRKGIVLAIVLAIGTILALKNCDSCNNEPPTLEAKNDAS